ncbi:class I alpha-mannosidase [Delitschia confertaspora ATCC 74209]|uniref:alpha-1,2-Mannosidase n=1 Tax=Delitschia confertaspora ATCC 74209 TaxID=1513339 RepID=A0A9P4MKY3_9PLEO|nr:class I alpha-mannosidase [Delitschia confertaspora ATCC 74209]
MPSSKMARRFIQPLSRRQQRFRTYSIGFVILFTLLYYFSRPIDDLALSFTRHQTWMNDKSNSKRLIVKGSYDWRKAPINHTLASYIPLPTGTPRKLPKVQFEFPSESSSYRTLREKRRVAVRNEFLRSWNSYKAVAWGRDELAPVSYEGIDTFGGWGATLVDSLDTLWIMGLKDDFYQAVEAVAQIDFGKSDSYAISVFETTIRYLGGLLSAYDLSGEKVLLEKAIQLGEMLYRSFDNPSHMPLDRLPIEAAKTGSGFVAESSISFAAVGSLTMEFVRLAQITQENKYYDAVARITTWLDHSQSNTTLPGMFPIWMDTYYMNMSTDRSYTLGAMADSSYEYFPKTFALLGGLEPVYEKLYKDSAVVIDKHMLFRPMLPDNADILYSGDLRVRKHNTVVLDPEFQHLTCFIGGYFALAGKLFSNPHHVDLGRKLTDGCIYAYAAMPTGIMPEIFDVVACEERANCPWNQPLYEEEVLKRASSKYNNDAQAAISELKLPLGFTALRDKRYLLRPEAIESVFLLYRITGEAAYMDHAWDMFTSIRKYSSTPFGNGQVNDITDTQVTEGWGGGGVEDKMESFWLAETLKYFYLIFSRTDMVSLDEWVFNTEAHPFRRPG